MKGTTATEDYKVCLEGVALLGEHDLDGAAAVLEPLLDSQDSPCRVEAAFLLGVVRLAQSVSVVVRRRAAADAFAIAAEGGNPVYSPAAAYRYATLLDTSDQEQLRACWQRVVDTGSRVYSPVAHYVIAQTWRRAGRDDEAEKSMIRAWGSMDPEYGPKAAVWLTEHAARAGKWDRVTSIGMMADFDCGHQERGTLPELTHDLFWLIDRFYARVAWPYAENDVEDPLGLVHNLMHTVDDFRWGWLLQESTRQRMNAIMGFEVLPPDWPHHDQPDQSDDEEAQS